jgi:hypothetical protein
MEPWMAIALFVAATGGMIGTLIVVGVRRLRAYREAIESLGLEYLSADAELARRLAGALPLFSRGEVDCAHVARGAHGEIELTIFDYTYRHPHRYRSGRMDSEHEGLVACLYRSTGPLDTHRVEQWAEPCKERYRTECEGPWLAVQPVRKKHQDETPTVEKLQALHRDLQQLLEALTGIT